MSTMFSEYESCGRSNLGKLFPRNPPPCPTTEEDQEPTALYSAPRWADYAPSKPPYETP